MTKFIFTTIIFLSFQSLISAQWTGAGSSLTLGTSPSQFYMTAGTTFDGNNCGIRFNNGSPVFNSKNGGYLYLNRDVNAGIVLGSLSHEFYFFQGATYDNTRAGIRVNNGSVIMNSKDNSILYLNRDVNSDVAIQSFSGGVTKDIAYFKKNGNVLIGKTTQVNANYKLDVAGLTRVDGLVVNTTGADFVFEDKYSLRPLPEVERFIKENNHLPEIAPAKEMQENGVEVGEMQTKLLQKIEELTLYMIDMQKNMSSMDKEIIALKKQNEELLKK